jgi:hypothetical protein
MGKRGPKPWEPTEEQIAKIKLYAGLGSTQEQIGTMIGISVDTLTRNAVAREAWETGQAETIAKVAGSLVKKALAGDTTSAIFYLKTQAGWRETVRNEHTGKDGGPIEYQNLSDEEIAARIAAHEQARGKSAETAH